MQSAGIKRKLSVILACDFEGYTRLMRADEEATLNTLHTYREIIDGMIARHGGHVFNAAGDSVVADFDSAVEAVRCAIVVQEELASRNARLPDDRKMRLRIGINLGDVMVDGENLLGDGVNVAARLESLAEPGGIWISEDVYHQIRHRLAVRVEDMGSHRIKNISEPVPAYKIVTDPFAGVARASPAWHTRIRWRTAAIVVGIIAVVTAGGVLLWETVFRPAPDSRQTMSDSATAVIVADKPSIVVLPFTNLTGNQSQDHLSDGVSEAIMTELGKFPQISVVAQNSAFTYKGKPVNVQQLGQELGVRYVLEGSVQRSGDRVRITAQLIEAASGKHLWAVSYDEELRDTLAIQDSVTPKVVAQMLMILGRPREAVMTLKRAIYRHPENQLQLLGLLAAAYYYIGEYDEAIAASQRYLGGEPEPMTSARIVLVASLVAVGRKEEAAVEVEKIFKQGHKPTAKAPVTRGVFGTFTDKKLKDRLYHHLRQAGLPE